MSHDSDDDPALLPDVKGHVVSMRTKGRARCAHGMKPAYSVAVCECGWSNTVAWGKHGAQDRAIVAHWESVKSHDKKDKDVIELAPCPVCGYDGEELVSCCECISDSYTGEVCECPNCHAVIPSAWWPEKNNKSL